jgi:hypothetical protein
MWSFMKWCICWNESIITYSKHTWINICLNGSFIKMNSTGYRPRKRPGQLPISSFTSIRVATMIQRCIRCPAAIKRDKRFSRYSLRSTKRLLHRNLILKCISTLKLPPNSFPPVLLTLSSVNWTRLRRACQA